MTTDCCEYILWAKLKVVYSNKHVTAVFRAAVEELLQEAKKAEAARQVLHVSYKFCLTYKTNFILKISRVGLKT